MEIAEFIFNYSKQNPRASFEEILKEYKIQIQKGKQGKLLYQFEKTVGILLINLAFLPCSPMPGPNLSILGRHFSAPTV